VKATTPIVPLENAYSFQEGPGLRKWQFKSEGIKVLNVGNITRDGRLDLSKTDRFISEEEVNARYRHFLVDAGDLVIASSGISFDEDGLLRTRGVFVGEEDLPLCMNTSTIRFKSKTDISDLGYLRHWIDGPEFRTQISRLVTGSAQQNFGPSHLRSIQITLPSLDEQRRIAAILDKADALRGKRKCALDLFEGLAQAIFLEMFGSEPKGELCQLSDLVNASDRINYGVVQPGEDDPDGIFLVRVSDLQQGRVRHSGLRRVSKQISGKHGRSVLKGNEILISCVGSIGEIALTSDAEKGFNIARAVARVPLDDELIRIYVAEYLRTPKVQEYFTKELRTVSQPTLNIKQISETRITIPHKAVLKEFENRVRLTGLGLKLSRLHQARADILFSSLQSRAFSGQL
jgi:type I restriction enzyme S subunit